MDRTAGEALRRLDEGKNDEAEKLLENLDDRELSSLVRVSARLADLVLRILGKRRGYQEENRS